MVTQPRMSVSSPHIRHQCCGHYDGIPKYTHGSVPHASSIDSRTIFDLIPFNFHFNKSILPYTIRLISGLSFPYRTPAIRYTLRQMPRHVTHSNKTVTWRRKREFLIVYPAFSVWYLRHGSSRLVRNQIRPDLIDMVIKNSTARTESSLL